MQYCTVYSIQYTVYSILQYFVDRSFRVQISIKVQNLAKHLESPKHQKKSNIIKGFVDYFIHTWQGSIKKMHLSLEFHYYSLVRLVSEHIFSWA